VGALVGYLRRTGLRKGVIGGDRLWMSVWVLVVGARLIRKLAAPKPVIEHFDLGPGQTIVVTDLGPAEGP